MKSAKWFSAVLLGLAFLSGTTVWAQGKGHGRGHDKDKHQDRDEHSAYSYREEVIRSWYGDQRENLPPGLAKKDRLPPGLEKQLVRNGTLPPGLQKRFYPVPVELERRLPPPPPDCAHVLVSGHLVLLNRKTNLIVDVFAF